MFERKGTVVISKPTTYIEAETTCFDPSGSLSRSSK
jgi:hypothetical protein